MTTSSDHPQVAAAARLLGMPLGEITETHGEAGLRRRLNLELTRLPAVDRRVIADAAEWAALLHAGQRRTREPYLNHVLRVALRILCYYHVQDRDVLVAALLHDAVEDQPWAVAGMPPGHGPPPLEEASAALADRYNPRVARLVGAVTNPERRPGIDRIRQYIDHLAGALAGEPWARVIKFSDFTDNGTGIIHTTGAKALRSAAKYRGAVPVLRALLWRPDTPLDPAVKQYIDRKFDIAVLRFDALAGAGKDTSAMHAVGISGSRCCQPGGAEDTAA